MKNILRAVPVRQFDGYHCDAERKQQIGKSLNAGGVGSETAADEQRIVIEPDHVTGFGGRGPVDVRLRVSLDFSARGRPRAQVLSPERRFAVIVISATLFLGIVFYSARKLLGVMR